jgi:hypothetical protein
MNRFKFAVLAIVVFAFGLAPSSAKADGGSVVDEYNVTGSLTIAGNNACPPASACAETIAFSFTIGSEYDPGNPTPYLSYVIPNSGSVESLGPLGQFSLATAGILSGNNGGQCGPFGDCNRIEFLDANGDEIDLHLAWASGSAPITPDVISGDLFECGSGDTATCNQQMFPPGECCMFNFGTLDPVAATAVAEPSSLLLLGAGLFALGLMISRRRRYC